MHFLKRGEGLLGCEGCDVLHTCLRAIDLLRFGGDGVSRESARAKTASWRVIQFLTAERWSLATIWKLLGGVKSKVYIDERKPWLLNCFRKEYTLVASSFDMRTVPVSGKKRPSIEDSDSDSYSDHKPKVENNGEWPKRCRMSADSCK